MRAFPVPRHCSHTGGLRDLQSGSLKTVVCMQIFKGLRRPASRLAFASNSSLLCALHQGGAALAMHPLAAQATPNVREVDALAAARGLDSTSSSSSTDGSADQQSSTQQPDRRCLQWRLHSGAAMLPLPEKAHRGGEDAYFISADGRYLGVSDGVGSWIHSGVDVGIFARALMSNAESKAAELEPSSTAPFEVMKHAQRETRIIGSATACIMALEGSMLHAANLGDSGFMVVRDGRPVFRTPQQQKDFNFPFQLGMGNNGDPVTAAEAFTVGLMKNDIIVTGTDGLWDNMFPGEVAAVVQTLRRHGRTPVQSATGLAHYAQKISNTKSMTPFGEAAAKVGQYAIMGGKPDDITVIVSYIREGITSKL